VTKPSTNSPRRQLKEITDQVRRWPPYMRTTSGVWHGTDVQRLSAGRSVAESVQRPAA
jgi:hypothetical protein